MADGMQIGSAFFELGLNASKLTQGMASAGSSVASATSKIDSRLGSLSNGFKQAERSIDSFTRPIERMTRGVRGMSSDMARAQEAIYRTKDAFKRLEMDTERANLRVRDIDQSIRRNAESMQLAGAKVDQHRQKIMALGAELAREQQQLARMQTDRGQDTEAIDRQQQKYAELAARHEKFLAIIPLEEQRLSQMRDAQIQFTQKMQIAVDAQARSITKHQELTDAVRVAENELSRLNHVYNGLPDQIRAATAALETQRASQAKNLETIKLEEAALTDLRARRLRFTAEMGESRLKVAAETTAHDQLRLALQREKAQLDSMRADTSGQYTADDIEQQRLKYNALNQKLQLHQHTLNEVKRAEAELGMEHQRHNTILTEQERKIDQMRAQDQQATADIKVKENALGGLIAQYTKFGDQIKKQESYIADEKARLQQLKTAMDSADLAVYNLTQQEKQQQLAMVKQEAEIDRLKVAVRGMNQELFKEHTELMRLQNTYGPSSAAVEKQAEKVRKLQEAVMGEEQATQHAARSLVDAREKQERLTRDRQRAVLTVQELKEREGALNVELDRNKQRLTEATEKEGRRKQALEARKQKLEQAKIAEEGAARATAQMGAASDKTTSGIGRMTSAVALVNERLFKMSSIVRDVLVGSLSSFIGNTLSSLITGTKSLGANALDAYKGYETLGLSLTALSARQMVSQGQFKSLELAQGAAAEKSKELISWMEKLAIQSPFSVDDISNAFRLGSALGFTSEQTQRLIRDTTDWAAATGGTGEQITSVIRALGQMHNTGHVTLEDINQMTDAGLSARDVLRNEFAPEITKSKKSLEDLISDGALPADRAIKALAESMEKDFGGGAAKAGGSMTGLLNSLSDLKNTISRNLLSKTFELVQVPLTNLVNLLQDPGTIGAIQHFGEILGSGVGNAINFLVNDVVPAAISIFRRFGPVVIDAFSFIAALADEAYQWGAGIGNELANGLASTIDTILSIINYLGEQIAYWLEPHSPPKILPNIDQWGRQVGDIYVKSIGEANTGSLTAIGGKIQKALGGVGSSREELKQKGKQSVEAYFRGWSDADFGMLDSVRDKVQSALDDLVQGGKIGEESVIPMLLGTNSEIKNAIDELRMTGDVSQQTFDRIRRAAGPAGQEVVDYAKALFKSEKATRDLQSAQDRLNAVTDSYDKKLNPLKAKLDSIQRSKDQKSRQSEIDRLKSLMSAELPEDMGFDRAKTQQRIDELMLEQQVDSIEAEKNAAVKAEEEKIKAAQKAKEAADAELKFREDLIAKQREQNELIRKQIELTEGKKKTAQEQAEEDRKAAADYAFGKATDAEKLKILEERQKKVRQGSKEWYDIQRDIDQLNEQIHEKHGKNSNKEEQDAARRQKAEDDYNASLGTTEEQLEETQRQLAEAEPGSVRYFQLKKREMELQEKLGKEQKKHNEEIAKGSEDEFDHALAMANSEEKMGLLQARLEQLDPASEEYAKRQEQLKKLQDEQTKSVGKLSDAEFEAKLATQDRAGKIAMLQERLGGLNKGTMEYEKTLKRLNALEFQEDHEKGKAGGGGPKGKGKGGPAKNDIFSGLSEKARAATKPVTETMNKLNESVERAKSSFATFKEKLEPFFKFLKENGQIVGFIIQKLLMSFVGALVLEKVLKPLLGFIWGLRQFLTLGNVVFLLLTGLGYAWKINLGGIRDIAAAVWRDIKAPLEKIVEIIGKVKNAFQNGGIGAAVETLISELPSLGTLIGQIGYRIAAGVAEWIGPFIAGLGTMFVKVVAWVQGGGASRLVTGIWEGITNLFGGSASSGAIVTGILGLIGGIGMILQGVATGIVKYSPTLMEGISNVFGQIGVWLKANLPGFIAILGVVLVGLLAGLLEGLIPFMGEVGKKIVDVAVWLIPLLPDLVSGLVTVITTAGTWLIARGIPLLIKSNVELFTYLFNKFGEMLPDLGLNLGRLIGSTITKVLIMLVTGIGALMLQLWQSIQDGSFQEKLVGFLKSIGNFIFGLLKGILGIGVGIILGLAEPLINALRGILFAAQNGAKQWLNDNFTSLGTSFVNWLEKAFGFVLNLFGVGANSPIRKLAISIIDGMRKGLDDGIVGLITFVVNLFDRIVQNVKNFLGIHSPSTVFSNIGQSIVDGLLAGLQFLTQLADTVIGWILDMETRIIMGFLTFTANFIAGALLWEDQVLAGIDTFVTKFLTFVTQLTLKVVQIFIDFFADLLAKFGINRDDVITVVTNLHDQFIEWIGKLDSGIRDTIQKLVDWWTKSVADTKNTIVQSVTDLKDDAMGILTEWDGKIRTLVNGVSSFLSGMWGTITTNARNGWTNAKEAARSAFDGVKGFISGITDTVSSNAETAWNSIKSTASQLWGETKDAAASAFTLADAIGGIVSGVFSDLFGNGDGGSIGNIRDKFGEMFQSAADAIGLAFGGISGTIREKINDVIDAVNDAIDDINGVASSLGLPTLPYIDRLALGTMFAKGGMTLVGENGPELVNMPRGAEVLPASRTMALFEDAAKSMIDEMMHRVDMALALIDRSVNRAAVEIARAARDQQPNVVTGKQIEVHTTTNEHVEHHDHWHLVVHTQASTDVVVDSYHTMQTVANLP